MYYCIDQEICCAGVFRLRFAGLAFLKRRCDTVAIISSFQGVEFLFCLLK